LWINKVDCPMASPEAYGGEYPDPSQVLSPSPYAHCLFTLSGVTYESKSVRDHAFERV